MCRDALKDHRRLLEMFDRDDLKLLTAADVARILHCSVQTVNVKCAARKLPAIKEGRSWLFHKDVLSEFIQAQARKHVLIEKPAPAPVLIASRRSNHLPILPPLSPPTHSRAAY